MTMNEPEERPVCHEDAPLAIQIFVLGRGGETRLTFRSGVVLSREHCYNMILLSMACFAEHDRAGGTTTSLWHTKLFGECATNTRVFLLWDDHTLHH